MDVGEAICRRCGESIAIHDHSSALGKFFCRGSHLKQEYVGQHQSELSEHPSGESTMRGMAAPVSCPFCGDPHGRFVSDPATCTTQVECLACGARSPRETDKDAALASWSAPAV
jgi:hypothetical protein